jgi:epoxyqueuosine reductase
MTSDRIKAKAIELGFDACGVAPATDLAELKFFGEWLARGYAGEMSYLHRSAEQRADVRRVMPSAKTVIVTATNYHTDRPYSTESPNRSQASLSRYAWGDDYHDIIRSRLDALVGWMRDESPEPFDARAYVDTGPVQERVYAQHAGIGWAGKNACIISPRLGSWLFLSEIICSLPLAVDEPVLDQCGTCTLCLEACPTGALVGPGVLDSTRCVSYLTIELRGDLPEALQPAIGNHVYGCDICQEVCPWNAAPPISADPAWQPRSIWDHPDLTTLRDTSDEDLAEGLRRSAMRRAKLAGLRRNIQIAVENVGLGDQ